MNNLQVLAHILTQSEAIAAGCLGQLNKLIELLYCSHRNAPEHSDAHVAGALRYLTRTAVIPSDKRRIRYVEETDHGEIIEARWDRLQTGRTVSGVGFKDGGAAREKKVQESNGF